MKAINRMIKSYLLILLLFVSPLSQAINVYAHRGGRALWPENTLTAYKGSLGLGVDYVDMDINLTKDNTFIVTHDLSLNRDITRDKNKKWIRQSTPIAELTEKEIKEFNVGKIKKNTPYAKEFFYQSSQSYEHIPTLIEVIHFVKGHQHKKTKYQIEVKTYEGKKEEDLKNYAAVLYLVLQNEKIKHLSEIQSFDFGVLRELHKLDKTLNLAFLTSLENKPANIETETYLEALLPKLKQDGATHWDPEFAMITKSTVKKAHELGLKVIVWGFSNKPVKERAQITKAIKLGVDGIITDNPSLIDWIKSQ